MDTNGSGDAKADYDLESPSLWCKMFSDGDMGTLGVNMLHAVLVEGIFIPNMKRGQLGVKPLVEATETCIEKVSKYPSSLLASCQDLLRTAIIVFLLYGSFPQLHQCRIEDLQVQLKDKKMHSRWLLANRTLTRRSWSMVSGA
jgi:hypothetical protein